MDKTLIAVIVGVAIIIIGFVIYTSMDDKTTNITVTSTSTPTTSSTTAQIEAERQRKADEQAARDDANAKTVAFTIDVTKLPAAQQASLKAMGVSSTSIEITNAMVTCAETDLSVSRVAEIKGGASVTMSEGIKLVSCYNAN